MYLLMPDFFLVPISYVKKDVLTIKVPLIAENFNECIHFKKRIEPVIGISLPVGGGEQRWQRDKDSLENYAKQNGLITKSAPNANNANEQSLYVDNLISQGINILILAPVDLSAAADIVEKAHKAGIKVIAYDRLIENTNLDLYISFDSVRVGELQGHFLIQKMPKGNYIVLSGDTNDNNSKLVYIGAMKYIKPLADKQNIVIVTNQFVDKWSPEKTYKIVKESLIANNNKIDAILSPNDAMAGAAIRALAEQDLAGKVPVTGQDAELQAVRRIIQRTQSMTVFKDVRDLAKTTIDAIIKLSKGEELPITAKVNNNKIDVPSILITPTLVDKNNINEVLINSGFLKPNEVYNI